jgi:DUF1680 family protein
MYCGMADVAALTGDHSYIAAIDRLWENVVGRKLHITGGIGASRKVVYPKWGSAQEAFGNDWELPNDNAYLETCAAIGNALWNQRMFLWKGESKYADIVEKTGLSTATITRVNGCLRDGNDGYVTVLDRLAEKDSQ